MSEDKTAGKRQDEAEAKDGTVSEQRNATVTIDWGTHPGWIRDRHVNADAQRFQESPKPQLMQTSK
jgi:hypothetical protein